ncbi:helix-turn-helix transcriptional regulator [Soonwooa sp.]|uniref:helix-turn-helix domain-containing protein n=1 Tax=Soonwooa sp. TaxID=1938592 RepID=UPI0026317A5F|nr:helix-turn-helix transcriptional regulator [Soonwooa sp.]
MTQEELTNVNTSIKTIEDKRLELQKKSRLQNTYIIITGLIIIGGILFYYFRQRKVSKNQKKSYEAIIKKLTDEKAQLENNAFKIDSEKEEDFVEIENQEIEKEEVLVKKQTISNELETIILQKLCRFERGNKYTNPSISLASLAGLLGTNTQYLSEIINKHKGKNFNAYINELRINNIIKRLVEDKRLANYKISSLAEEAGFSSHSLFSKVFKQVANMSPSEFVQMHQNQNPKS